MEYNSSVVQCDARLTMERFRLTGSFRLAVWQRNSATFVGPPLTTAAPPLTHFALLCSLLFSTTRRNDCPLFFSFSPLWHLIFPCKQMHFSFSSSFLSRHTITQLQSKWQQTHFALCITHSLYRRREREKREEGRKQVLIALYFCLSFVSPNYKYTFSLLHSLLSSQVRQLLFIAYIITYKCFNEII